MVKQLSTLMKMSKILSRRILGYWQNCEIDIQSVDVLGIVLEIKISTTDLLKKYIVALCFDEIINYKHYSYMCNSSCFYRITKQQITFNGQCYTTVLLMYWIQLPSFCELQPACKSLGLWQNFNRYGHPYTQESTQALLQLHLL